jgi:hypothetical protein
VIKPKGQHILTRVNELIDPTTNTWDADLVNQTFWPIDARRILAIPLSAHMMEDFVSWHFTKTGIFSVRSAYFVEWESQFRHRVNCSDDGPMNDHPMWAMIWKLRVPSKVKICIRRIMQETLPCRVVLANRHMRVSPQCPLCLIGAEDIKHLLFECQRARQVWDHLGLGQVIDNACAIDRAGQAVLEHILYNEVHLLSSVGNASIPELVVVTAWHLWWERCKATRGEALQDPERIARAIEALYSNYCAANSPKAKPKREGWVKPLSDHVKVNVDASFDADQLRGTTGAVIRDWKGNFVAACNTKLDFVIDALSAEAHALKQGLILAETMGCNRIIISSDCSDVIKIMQDRGNSSGVAAAVFDDCYHLSSNFSRVLYEHSF